MGRLRLLVLVLSLVSLFSPFPAGAAPNMTYHNGTVIQNPKIYITFWGVTSTTLNSTDDPDNKFPSLQKFFANIGGTRWLNPVVYYKPTGSYTITNPKGIYSTASGYWADTSAVPNDNLASGCSSKRCPNRAHLAAEAVAAATHFGTLTNPDAIQVIVTPPTVGIVDAGNCAYHYYATNPNGGAAIPFIFIPYISRSTYWANGASSWSTCPIPNYPATSLWGLVGHHELLEAITDPRYNGIYGANSGDEISDWCTNNVPPMGYAQLGSSASTMEEFLLASAVNTQLSACVASVFSHENRFVIGSDSNLYQRGHDFVANTEDASWANWGKPSGVNLVGMPGAVSWDSKRIDVASVGTDGNLWHMWSDDGGVTRAWDNQGNPGISFYNEPEAASWGPNSLDLFVIGADFNLYHKRWFGSWGAWQNWGHPAGVTSIWGVSAASGMLNQPGGWGSRSVDVFVVGGDGNLYDATSFDAATVAFWTNVGDLGTGGGLGFGTGSAAWGPDWLSAFTTAPTGGVLHAIYHVTTDSWTHESWGAPSGANLYNQAIGATTIGTGYLLADAIGSNLAQEKTWLQGTQGSWTSKGAPPGGLAPPLGWVEASAW